ncbi:MAG TPA: hypothetical protein VGP68_06515 [Gemmataceae bacterium]|nr:hypothetical protein [Gemmataceae bacterium]
MAKSKLPLLQVQIRRAYRRLQVQSVLNALVWCWVPAILLAAGWCLVEPWILDAARHSLRWQIAAGLFSAGTLTAIAVGWKRAPSLVDAALSIDERFDLRERVTTSLTLAPDQAASPAGQALLADVNKKIAALDIHSKFPLRLSGWAALVPAAALILGLVGVFYEPTQSKASLAKAELTAPPANAKDLDQKMQDLKRKKNETNTAEKPKSEDLEKLEAELDQIANKPRNNKEEVRERIKEMTSLEQQMKEKEKDMTDRSRALKQQLQKLDKMAAAQGAEGPTKNLEKSLAQGKFDKAKEEIERLAKQLQNNSMDEKQKAQLKEQLDKLKDKIQELAEQKDKERQLKEMNLDPETLKRELAQLKKDTQKMKDLANLAKQLGQAQQKLKEGDSQGAADMLAKAGEQLKKMGADDKDLEDIRDQLTRLQDAKDAAGEGLDQRKDMINDNELTEDANDQPAGQGAGRRPLGKAKPFKSYDAKTKSEFDAKGKKIFDGYAPGQTFRSKKGAEMIGDIKQASQDAPEAIEQQRIPRAAADMSRGYFKNMRQQADSDPKK